jgi:hypothetical protein
MQRNYVHLFETAHIFAFTLQVTEPLLIIPRREVPTPYHYPRQNGEREPEFGDEDVSAEGFTYLA